MSLIKDALRRASAERLRKETPPEVARNRPACAPPPPSRPAKAREGARPLDRRVLGHAAPFSAEAQQYTNLHTHVVLALDGTKGRVLLLCSAVAGEGKSLSTANLAACIARSVESRVLAIDADVRTPRLHALLGVDPGPGLADYLTGHASLDGILHPSPLDRLTVVPAGIRAAAAIPLLTSPRLRELIVEARSRADDVLIDAGPVLALADARALASLTDGVVLVVRAGHTGRHLVESALERLHGARVLGLLLNRVRRAELGPYYRNIVPEVAGA